MRPRNYELYPIEKIADLQKQGVPLSKIAKNIGADHRRLSEWLDRCWKISKLEYERK